MASRRCDQVYQRCGLQPVVTVATAVTLLTTVLALAWLPARIAWTKSKARPTPTTAREILNHIDDLHRGDSAQGRMRMSVTTAHWQRTLQVEFWSQGKDLALMRILNPRKERGTSTLRDGFKMWNYLPKVKRVIKVPSSMMGGSWMGSHFTNDDLVRSSRMAEDYKFSVTFTGDRDGQEVTEITCIPRPDAPVVWGMVVVQVETKRYTPTWVKYYDEAKALARVMTFGDVQQLTGGRWVPMRSKIVPTDKQNEFTELVYESIAYDIDLPKDLFTLRTLRR